MRAQTPSYVVSTKVQLPESITERLEKSFRISNSAYNEALSFGLKRFEALKRNSYYQELLEARRLALKGISKLEKAEKTAKGLKQQVKCYNKALFELRKVYMGFIYYLFLLVAPLKKKVVLSLKANNTNRLHALWHHFLTFCRRSFQQTRFRFLSS